jgi:hypothetical protein
MASCLQQMAEPTNVHPLDDVLACGDYAKFEKINPYQSDILPPNPALSLKKGRL